MNSTASSRRSMGRGGGGGGRGRGRKGHHVIQPGTGEVCPHPTGDKASQRALYKDMNSVSSQLAGVIENLRSQMAQLDAELKADKDGAKEYQDEIDKLNRRKTDLKKNIKKNQEWCDNFDKQIGGVQDKYDHFLDDMVVLYDNACKKHAQGIQFLMDHFSYHPLFKHWDDDFTAVPFRPKAK